MGDRLLIRADASSAIGVGHAMRCLALAQAWQDTGGAVTWLARELPASLAGRLQRERIDLHEDSAEIGSARDARETQQLARKCAASWAVVDGYRFGADFLSTLRSESLPVLGLDDMFHLERYPVDVLLNQNLSATAGHYAGRIDDSATLLLGPRYSLLRREFRKAASARREPIGARWRVLVSFGGGDAENFTERILQRLTAIAQPIEVRVLAGAANPHVAALRRAAASASFPCDVHVDVENVADAMRWADVAITAAGSTVWELACLRVPALIGASDENQLAGVQALGSVPFFRARKIEDLLACELGRELAELLRALPAVLPEEFDGQGATRVVAAMARHPVPEIICP